MNNLNLFVAFGAGLVSFLSPCVLPILPGFLLYLSGSSFGEAAVKRKSILLNSLFFVLGFSLIFALLGVLLNSFLLSVSRETQKWLSFLGGLIIIAFGLQLSRLLKIPFLEREFRFNPKLRLKSRELTSFIFGAAFAFGWTPCVGAVLGSILGLAASHPGQTFSLLSFYSFGLGLPFLLVGLFTVPAINLLKKFSRLGYLLNIGFGFLLIILGILVFTQELPAIANFSLLDEFIKGRR